MQLSYKELSWLFEGTEKSEEYTLGREFISGFGTSDLEGQLNRCDMYISRFNKLLELAHKEKEGKVRVYFSLGAMAGVGVFILLI